jgi:hypothetical protein
MSVFLWNMKNLEENCRISEQGQSQFLQIVESRWFAILLMGFTALSNIVVAVTFEPPLFQRLGSLNVAVGVFLLILSGNRLRRLERQRTLYDLGMLVYEISRLSSDLSEMKDGGYPTDSRDALNKNSAFGDSLDFDYQQAMRSEKAVSDCKREARFSFVIEIVFVLVGTIQWGFGDLALNYLIPAVG